MVAQHTPPNEVLVPEPETVLGWVIQLRERLKLSRAQLRLSERYYGRVAVVTDERPIDSEGGVLCPRN